MQMQQHPECCSRADASPSDAAGPHHLLRTLPRHLAAVTLASMRLLGLPFVLTRCNVSAVCSAQVWIFVGLNKADPAAAVTLRQMDRH